MNVLRSGIVTMLLLAAFSVQAACTWPAWEQFKKDYISQEGQSSGASDAGCSAEWASAETRQTPN